MTKLSTALTGPVARIVAVALAAVSPQIVYGDELGRRSGRGLSEWRFDAEPAGKMPAGWTGRQTNPTKAPATWRVLTDPTAPSQPQVFGLTHSENYDGTFNLAIAQRTKFRDLDLSVKVKAVRGEEDQGGGPIWRYRDENNYYICRFNPLESNFRVYYVEEGRRKQLQSAKIKTKPGRWYQVRVTMIGEHIICYLDGEELLDVHDKTFGAAGMVGLWTKADAVTYFDDLALRDISPSLGSADSSPQPSGRRIDTKRIEQIVGLKGSFDKAENVFKVTTPRTDVSIFIDEQRMHPFRGLTSWAAFQDGKRAEAMVMGDLVLFQDEVNAVMSAALDTGLTVTALHNHFFYDDPKVYFMHIGGEGTAEQLARGVRAALDAVEKVRKQSATPATRFAYPRLTKSNIGAAPIERILGAKARRKEGMVKFVFGRKVTMACGCEVSAGMGVNTWAVFAGTDQHAVVDGDFACLPGELQPTLKALRRHDINIVAIHNHMEEEEPRVIFLHYWGAGSATNLARAIKVTLEAQKAIHE